MRSNVSAVRLVLVAALAASVSLGGVACALPGAVDDLDGTQWRLVEWSVSSLAPQDFEITLGFDGDQLGGKAAVNSYGGSYSTGRQGAFSTGDIAQTLMAGPEPAMRAESVYFELLAQAERYSLDGARLVLSTAAGVEVLVFERAP